MATFDIFGARYQLPEVRDARFAALQDNARERRELLDKARHTRMLLGFIPVPGPRLTEEERLAEMQALLDNYEQIQAFLKAKASDLNTAFDSVAQGVAGVFHERAQEIRAQERKRQELYDRSVSLGEQDVLETVRVAEQHNRDLSTTLARAIMVILKNIEAARLAVAALAGSKHVQEGVLANLQDKVRLYREIWEYKCEARRLQSDIEEITRIALDFNGILREQLGPVYELVREVGRVDDSVAQSMAEVEVLTRQLASGASFDRFGGDPENDPLVAALVYRELSEDLVQELIRRIEDPGAHIEESEALRIDRDAEGVPVMTVLDNIEMVIDMQVAGTLGSTLGPMRQLPGSRPEAAASARPLPRPAPAPRLPRPGAGPDNEPAPAPAPTIAATQLWTIECPGARSVACTNSGLATLYSNAIAFHGTADGVEVCRVPVSGATHLASSDDAFLVGAGTSVRRYAEASEEDPTEDASFDEAVTALAAAADDEIIAGTVSGSIVFDDRRETINGRPERLAATRTAVAVVTNRKELVVLDRESGAEKVTIAGVRSVAALGSDLLAVVSTNGALTLLNEAAPAAEATPVGTPIRVPAGASVAAAYPADDGVLLVIDGGEPPEPRLRLALLNPDGSVEKIEYDPGEPFIAVCGRGDAIYILTRGRTLHALQR